MGAKMQAKKIALVVSALVAAIVVALYAVAETVIEYTYDAAGNPTKVEIKTDPAHADTDGDGMPDEWETRYGLNPSVNDAGEDLDADGLTNLDEYQRGTKPNDTDTDNDGINDGWEVRYGLNPVVNDAYSDQDADGLKNIEEYTLGTLPNNADTDDDGMPDGWEVRYGLNPLANDAGEDLDADGLTNLAEYQQGTDPSGSNAVAVDITADPDSISSGNSATLTWSAENAQSCTIEPGVGAVAATGSRLVTPAATTAYTITATGAAGTAQNSTTITVTAAPPPTVSIWHTWSGCICIVSWTSTNADRAYLSVVNWGRVWWAGWVGTSGSFSQNLSNYTMGCNYTITVYGPGGSASRTLGVSIPSGCRP